jgi:hypothetical protein
MRDSGGRTSVIGAESLVPMSEEVAPMTQVANRNGGRNIVVFDPSQEFEDIYDRMGQLMGFAVGEPAAAALVRPSNSSCPVSTRTTSTSR